MIVQVPDELVFDVPKTELNDVVPRILEAMRHAVRLNVPMELSQAVGETWYEAK